jgi:hypothetical protein
MVYITQLDLEVLSTCDHNETRFKVACLFGCWFREGADGKRIVRNVVSPAVSLFRLSIQPVLL